MTRNHIRGVSLIEALVALAVMAFGLLGVAGMQASLRATADSSRQRTEAVRLAQEKVEAFRSFHVLSGAPSGDIDFDDIASGSDTPSLPTGYGNTTFTRTWTVTGPVTDGPPMKVVTVTVAWSDRAGRSDSVSMATNVFRGEPVLGASRALRGDRSVAALPRNRNLNVPPGAVDNGNGTSTFTPPGGSGQTWTIDNISGLVTETSTDPNACRTTGDTPVARCMLLWGTVRFLNAGTEPSETLAELPSGSRVDGTGVSLAMAQPTTPASITCFTENGSTRVSYYCLVQGTATAPVYWTGQTPTVRITGLALATSQTDNSASLFKVCRYTPVRNQTPPRGNVDNPRTFSDVRSSMGNKNYLVIRAGNGSSAYTCPADANGETELVNGNTCPHQPDGTCS